MKKFIIIIKKGSLYTADLEGIDPDKAREVSNKKNIVDFIQVINQNTINVKQLPIIIGRSEDANIILSPVYTDVSRTHAEIFEEDSTVKIRDLGSTHGTFILREQQEPLQLTKHGIQLYDHDTILLGKRQVLLEISFQQAGIFTKIKNWFS